MTRNSADRSKIYKASCTLCDISKAKRNAFFSIIVDNIDEYVVSVYKRMNVVPFDRVFARSRHRKTANSSSGGGGSNEGSEGFDPYRSWSPLTEEGYAEKLRLLREAASVPMERWRAPTVLAWLEVALGMPQYGPRCAENVKSGKVKASSASLTRALNRSIGRCDCGSQPNTLRPGPTLVLQFRYIDSRDTLSTDLAIRFLENDNRHFGMNVKAFMFL